jgi:tetratricopeptide (TPR) repeat protein
MVLIALVLLVGSIGPRDAPTALAMGDEAFYRIDYPSSISAYESVLSQRGENPETLWRLARVYVCAGEVADERHRGEFFKTAESYARRCIHADSLSVEGHTWLAAALGYITLFESLDGQIALSHELLHVVDRAITLNPKNDIAYSIRGSFYRALGNVSWVKKQIAAVFLGSVPAGGFEESEAALMQAITLAPNVMRHQYELAILYIDWNRREEARKILDHASTLPIQTAIDRPRLANIRRLLEELRGDH